MGIPARADAVGTFFAFNTIEVLTHAPHVRRPPPASEIPFQAHRIDRRATPAVQTFGVEVGLPGREMAQVGPFQIAQVPHVKAAKAAGDSLGRASHRSAGRSCVPIPEQLARASAALVP